MSGTNPAGWDWRAAEAGKASGKEGTWSAGKSVLQIAVLGGVGGLFFWKGHATPAYVLWGLAALPVLALLGWKGLRKVLGAVERVLARAIGGGLTWLLLTPIFYLVFGLGHLLKAVTGHDSMERRPDPKAKTYWKKHDNRNTAARWQKEY